MLHKLIQIRDVPIDNEAKSRVSLFPHQDQFGDTYYTGKLQFGTLWDLTQGASFFIFLDEPQAEELQISMLPPGIQNRRIQEVKNNVLTHDGKLKVPLSVKTDRNGNTYYVGEVKGPIMFPLYIGAFFSVFVAKEGKEELQISLIDHSRQKRANDSGEYASADIDE